MKKKMSVCFCMGRPSTIFPGKIINNWIFVKQTNRVDKTGYRPYWIVICPICKKESEKHDHSIRYAKSKSCGCTRGCVGNKRISIADKKFGKLTALYPTSNRKFGKICWMFQCECGTVKEIESSHVVSGATKTCGCFRTIGRRGKLHHNYNHNKTDLERELDRGIPGIENWRIQIYERDNFTCQICFKKSEGDLNAHHINCWAKYPNERLNIDNDITLCVKCHTNFHILYGRGNTNKEQWNEYVASYRL